MAAMSLRDIHLLAERVQERRITHEEVAKAVGLSRNRYTEILNGSGGMPSYNVARKIAEFFDIPLGDIIFGATRKTKAAPVGR